MAKKVASILNALHLREVKAWRVIDQHLRLDNKIPANIRQAAAEFILKRIYPEKTIVSGAGENGEFVVEVKITDVDNASQESGNRISEYFKV